MAQTYLVHVALTIRVAQLKENERRHPGPMGQPISPAHAPRSSGSWGHFTSGSRNALALALKLTGECHVGHGVRRFSQLGSIGSVAAAP
jgi:hypothetical protein